MDKLENDAAVLARELASVLSQLKFDELETEAAAVAEQISAPDFWEDSSRAKKIMQRQAKLEKWLAPWRELKKEIQELVELAKMGDASLEIDLKRQLASVSTRLAELKDELKLSGPYDDRDAVVTLLAGAGGTDAQDWAQMLERMYLRFAEKSGWRASVVEESAGDEAGIKSATLEISGEFAYGKLKGEHGVHRLVRLSPFNSAASRETSFAKVEIAPKIDEPSEVQIDEKDLRIDVYRSGGHGGQSVNTTDSAVRITHLPTGLVVAIQNERSQLQNKDTALAILRSKLAQLQLDQHASKISELKPDTGANEFGSQIRNYVLHPYKQVKDLRTGYESSDPYKVLAGELDGLIDAYLNYATRA